MKTRIEPIGNEFFLDFQLPDGGWKNYGCYATYDQALRGKEYMLACAAGTI